MRLIIINSLHNTRIDKFRAALLFTAIELHFSWWVRQTFMITSRDNEALPFISSLPRCLNLWAFRFSRKTRINAIKGNNARVFIEKATKKCAAPICEKIYWWSRAQRSIKCFTFNRKKIFIYLLSAIDSTVFQLHFFSFSPFSAELQQRRVEILIYFSCSSPRHIIHVIYIGDTRRKSHS